MKTKIKFIQIKARTQSIKVVVNKVPKLLFKINQKIF